MVNEIANNARDLELELDWFGNVLEKRLENHFKGETSAWDFYKCTPPDLSERDSFYSRFVTNCELTLPERLVIILALIPHIRPQKLDLFWVRNENTERGFTEFGGLRGVNHSGFIPTGETAAFIIAADNLEQRFQLNHLFEADHPFAKHKILTLSPVATGEPFLSGALTISSEYLYWFITGIERKPNYNSEFPAHLIETKLSWDNLVLPAYTLDQLSEINDWINYGDTLLVDWGMNQKLKPGFTSLFYGPPGTGKTFSACLLGKQCNCDVYRIDLSLIISKYIGETEKNLAKIFDMAEHKRWILFFDEADALFGKRTKVTDSHDRYANQEVSYLLQRIEDFNGVVILASNLKTNIDAAFTRRFQSMISFPMPKYAERLRIWKNAFSPRATLDKNIDFTKIAESHEISGGTIMNVVRFASLRTLTRNSTLIRAADIEEGIRRELHKEGRML
jgi:hypothetical protein